MIINPYVFGAAVDPDAQAFITAAGLTNPTQQSAINTLVVSMKGFGIWTKMKAIYPFVGGTATTHKFNLKNPADTNAAFRLVFFGGMTHTANGVQGNGTNGYADTFFNPNTGYSVNDNAHISLYSRINSPAIDCDMGVAVGGSEIAFYILRSDLSNNSYATLNNGSGTYISFADTDSLGMYISTRIATSVKYFKNNVLRNTITNTAIARPNANIFISTLNGAGTPNPGLYSNKQYAFASIGDGLTDTDSSNFYTAVQAFNTTLGRQV
jgi:hypothetical protein